MTGLWSRLQKWDRLGFRNLLLKNMGADSKGPLLTKAHEDQKQIYKQVGLKNCQF